jgi:hypothetical protein
MKVELLDDQVEDLVRKQMQAMIMMLTNDLHHDIRTFSQNKDEDKVLIQEHIEAAQKVLAWYGG